MSGTEVSVVERSGDERFSVELAPARETLELCTFTSRADESEQVS